MSAKFKLAKSHGSVVGKNAWRRPRLFVAAFILPVCFLVLWLMIQPVMGAGLINPGITSLVSSSASGVIGNASSSVDYTVPVVSADNNYTVFASEASNLVSGDTNGVADIFRKDNRDSSIVRVSTSATGGQANGASIRATVSADGRYVAFQSTASNLISVDTNNWQDCFVKDVLTGAVTRISTDSNGNQVYGDSSRPVISRDGHYVAFISTAANLYDGDDTNGLYDVFRKDLQTGAISPVSKVNFNGQFVYGNAASDDPSISADGRYVAFSSLASNLVAGDSNDKWDVFVKNVEDGSIVALSKNGSDFGNGDSDMPSISADGKYVAYSSNASNLVSGDTNNQPDIFRAERQSGALLRADTDAAGAQVSGLCMTPAISDSGRYVAFMSFASTLVSGDNNNTGDIFRKNLQSGAVERISKSTTGGDSNDNSELPSINPGGSIATFVSAASNLISSDTNGKWDVFLRALNQADNSAVFAMTVDDNGSGTATIKVNWQPGTDANNNAVAKVRYRLYPSNRYAGGQPAYTEQQLTHASGQASVVMTGIRGRYYDFQVEVSDPDGVEGNALQQQTAFLMRDARFQFTEIASNPHSTGGFDEVQVRDFVNGKLYWGTNMNWWPDTISNMSQAYESTLLNGNVSEYAVPGGKAAWQSVVDRARGKVYIAGEMPRTADSPDGLHYRSMIGVITEGTNPTLNTYLVPGTDDVNELIGLCMDTAGNRLIAGERALGTPLADTNPGWSSGGGLWSIPLSTINQPSTYKRIYQDPANREWSHLMIFKSRIYVQMGDNTVMSAALSSVKSGMLGSRWRVELPGKTINAMIVSRNSTKLFAVTQNADYTSTIYTNSGSAWNGGVRSEAWAPWSIFELTDGRLMYLLWWSGNTHVALVSNPVTGDFEFLEGANLGASIPGVGMGGGGANYNFIYNGNDIYYGTIQPGKVYKVTYTP